MVYSVYLCLDITYFYTYIIPVPSVWYLFLAGCPFSPLCWAASIPFVFLFLLKKEDTMRHLYLTLTLLFSILFSANKPVLSQTSTWIDSLAVTTTEVDTTFSPRWNGCCLWFDNCTGLVRFGTTTTDTVSWSSKKWFKLEENQVMRFMINEYYNANHLWRLEYKAVSGTGILYIVGYKNAYQ